MARFYKSIQIGEEMRQLPSNQLNPKIKSVWRLSSAIWIIIVFLCCTLPFVFIGIAEPSESWALIVAAIEAVSFLAIFILCVFILPPIRYARWRYELSEDFIDISLGIVWRKRFIIPFIRVQNTDTQQGPVLRMFGLSSVTVSTAAGSHSIPGLDNESAEQLRDRAAELARIAREDV